MRSPSRARSKRRSKSSAPPRAHLSARADGGARAARQSFRRHRRDLQRRLVLAHARAMRHPARAHVARGRCLLRPPADDGPRRAGRRRGRSRARTASTACAALLDDVAAAFSRAGRALRQHRLAAGPHRRPPASCSRSWRGSSAPAAMSAAPRPRLRCAHARSAYPPYDELDVRGAGARAGRRQCARLGAHPRGRAEPVADRADLATAAGRADPGRCRRRAGETREGLGLVEGFRGDVLVWLRIDGDGASRAATCAIRPGSSGRCSKP